MIMMKLGNISIWAMAAGCLLASCSESGQEPVTPAVPDSPVPVVVPESEYGIGFNATVEENAATRAGGSSATYGFGASGNAGIETDEDMKLSGFGVYAYYTGTATVNAADPTLSTPDNRQIIMQNQQVRWDDTSAKWHYSPTRYWPGSNQYLSFYAYAPYSSAVAASPTDGGKPYLTGYTLTGGDASFDDNIQVPVIYYTHASQHDILYGVSTETSRYGLPNVNWKRPSDNTVPWRFRHALARVRFNIVNYVSLEAFNANRGIPGYTREGQYYRKEGDAFYYEHAARAADDVKLFITDVTIEHLNTKGTLSLHNSTADKAEWSGVESEASVAGGGTPQSMTPLNADITYTTTPTVSNWDSMNGLTTGESTYLLSDPNRYVLVLPKDYDADKAADPETDDHNIRITISYKVLAKWNLANRYTSDGEEFIKDDSFSGVSGVSGDSDDPYVLEASFDFDIEDSKTYVVNLRLGKMMTMDYQVWEWYPNAGSYPADDWDSWTVTPPTFE